MELKFPPQGWLESELRVGLTQAFADGSENSWGHLSLQMFLVVTTGERVLLTSSGWSLGLLSLPQHTGQPTADCRHPNVGCAKAEGARSMGTLLVAAAALFLVAL